MCNQTSYHSRQLKLNPMANSGKEHRIPPSPSPRVIPPTIQDCWDICILTLISHCLRTINWFLGMLCLVYMGTEQVQVARDPQEKAAGGDPGVGS